MKISFSLSCPLLLSPSLHIHLGDTRMCWGWLIEVQAPVALEAKRHPSPPSLPSHLQRKAGRKEGCTCPTSASASSASSSRWLSAPSSSSWFPPSRLRSARGTCRHPRPDPRPNLPVPGRTRPGWDRASSSPPANRLVKRVLRPSQAPPRGTRLLLLLLLRRDIQGLVRKTRWNSRTFSLPSKQPKSTTSLAWSCSSRPGCPEQRNRYKHRTGNTRNLHALQSAKNYAFKSYFN